MAAHKMRHSRFQKLAGKMGKAAPPCMAGDADWRTSDGWLDETDVPESDSSLHAAAMPDFTRAALPAASLLPPPHTGSRPPAVSRSSLGLEVRQCLQSKLALLLYPHSLPVHSSRVRSFDNPSLEPMTPTVGRPPAQMLCCRIASRAATRLASRRRSGRPEDHAVLPTLSEPELLSLCAAAVRISVSLLVKWPTWTHCITAFP